MTMRRRLMTTVMAVMMAAVAASPSAARENAKLTLSATGVEARAKGKASLAVKSASSGRLDVNAQRLAGDAPYDLILDGIKVLTVHTGRGGRLKVRLSTAPRPGRDAVLGCDPRGATIEIRNADGADVLVGTMPGPAAGGDPDDVTCCVPDDDATECEDRTPAECAAAGGTVSTASSCLPDPCGAVPPADRDVVCCIPDDEDDAECEDRTQPECLAEGGTIVEAVSCAIDPCVGTTPPVEEPTPVDPTATPIPTSTPIATATPVRTATPIATATPVPTFTPPPDATCADLCWYGFWQCLDGCTQTYCAAFCQVDLGHCLDACPD